MAYTSTMRLLLLLGVWTFTLSGVHGIAAVVPAGCQTIRSSLCDDILRYRVARFPNLVGNSNSREAAQALDNMFPSSMVQMAPNMIRVMCHMYFPACVEGQAATLPCRSLCEAASEESARIRAYSGMGSFFSMPCEGFPVCDEVSHNTTDQGGRSEWQRNTTSHHTTSPRPGRVFEEVAQSSGPDFPMEELNSLIGGYNHLMNATTELAEAKQEMVKEQTKLAREQTKLAREQTKLAKMESRQIWLENKRRKKSKA